MSDSSAAGFVADAIVVGAGLAGLVAACELVDRGLRVLIVDQENSANLGGQAFWSFGGLFFVDSPEQRRLGIRDSHELALQDWLGTAAFDRAEDYWPRQWAHAYVDFAAGEKRSWLRERGLKIFPLVGWANLHHCHWECAVYYTETVQSAERVARRAGVVRVAVAASHLRKPGPLQAMLDSVDIARLQGCEPTAYQWRANQAVLDAA